MNQLSKARIVFAFLAALAVGRAMEYVAIEPANRVPSGATAWRDLAQQFEKQPGATAEFVEKRHFPFHKEPIALRGEVRVSRERGLSLHYTAPDERVVIIDRDGMLIRQATSQQAAPDPRANLANNALLNILRFDFLALEKEFEIYGRRADAEWTLGLVPRADALRRAIGNIHVAGTGATVRRIELRRSAKQHIDIEMSAPRAGAFSAEELKSYFR